MAVTRPARHSHDTRTKTPNQYTCSRAIFFNATQYLILYVRKEKQGFIYWLGTHIDVSAMSTCLPMKSLMGGSPIAYMCSCIGSLKLEFLHSCIGACSLRRNGAIAKIYQERWHQPGASQTFTAQAWGVANLHSLSWQPGAPREQQGASASTAKNSSWTYRRQLESAPAASQSASSLLRRHPHLGDARKQR